ncbi:lasso peptide biosynthesis B2 protein [Cytobacillus kochii]|uniref:lasso peptide biosynthesis B2 protein n=1 Tax=Cytobacillus TaxID=2675230 RepID=UPI00278A2D25|nr:lasso peptide biosynthesis B2 protein [Cytobacillus kochii]MDQ0187228.1 hypothetical protein [Cytobacillus kochii]MED1604047.1 lasso peptide biosynthesis B2 protein [Cytobacillus kochii]
MNSIIFHKLKHFLALPWEKKQLLIEALIYLAYARIYKQLPFSKVSHLLGKHMKETEQTQDLHRENPIQQISEAVHHMSRYTFWESECLVKAVACMKMLERRGIESTLYLGTARDDYGEFVAHAWLRSGTFFLSGAHEKDKFTIVSMFACIPKKEKERW